MRRLGLVVSVLCASCVSTTSNVCEDGSVCPGGFICDLDNDRCLLPEQISVCEGIADGTECAFAGISGACRAGACDPFTCGDGIVSAGEECDGANLAGLDCKDFDYYGTEGLACSPTCQFELAGCAVHASCGDTIINGPELCDGPETRSCVSLGFDAGAASCTNSCTFTINDCSRFGWNPESLSDVVAHAVAGTARDDLWAVGGNGRAMHYEGVQWNTVPTNVQNTLIRAWSNAKNDTWAVGQSRASGPTLPSVVLRWDGTAWATVSGVPAGEYVDVWGASPTAVYVATNAGNGIHAFDGTSWSTLPSFTGEPIALRGTSSTDIWVATRSGPLMHFNGSSWQDRSPSGAAIQFVDANTMNDVWAIGHLLADPGTGVIAHWDGLGWTQFLTAQEAYNAVASSAPNDAWVAGVDGIMRHWDGVAWSRSTNVGASPSGLSAVSDLLSIDAYEVIAVSTLNLAYRYKGQAFGLLPALGSNPFDAPQNTAMWASNTRASYVTNVEGEVWQYDGATWSLAYTIPNGPTPATHIAGSSETDIWIVDAAGSAHQYAGVSWTAFEVTPAVALQKVWTDGTDVWVFGHAGALRKNGATWTAHALSSGRILSVSATSASDIWVVEDGDSAANKLWHWDGATWTEQQTNASFQMLAVAALAPDDVHVTAEEGRMLRFNGTSWSESVIPVLADLTAIAATAADDVVAASERDLAHFNGIEWSTMRPPVDFVPNSPDYLPIVDVFVHPGRIDILQKKYRVRTLIRTRPLVCRIRETCGDAVDNDCDGLIDDRDAMECP